MADKIMNWMRMIEDRFPGLIAKVREDIEISEKKFETRNGKTGFGESHLWEHTTHVASLAFRLAREENRPPLLPTLAALFHDVGKFAGGNYHEENTIEEEESAETAKRVLSEAGIKPGELAKTLAGIKALYNEKTSKNSIAAIVHDADFLSKFGAMGVAAFFTKATLRGRTIESAMLGYLSKELTYAACLPRNMRTAAGKKLAAQKARDTIGFFRKLLGELRESCGVGLRIRRLRISDPRSRKKQLEILLAASTECRQCGSSWRTAWFIEDGVKCTKLNVEWHCAKCGDSLGTSFCLPEV
ncbi:MAG: HD domain-containing protein [Acidobacteriota bacterium]|jgi:HD superfamily phosphodiesterase|nr:HD domain-containing protein [Acidobacteriota bacterium]